jgi:predicted nucleic acid-binding protein
VIRSGIPRRALRLACDQDVLAMSQPVWDELIEVLHRPRLARFIDALGATRYLNCFVRFTSGSSRSSG